MIDFFRKMLKDGDIEGMKYIALKASPDSLENILVELGFEVHSLALYTLMISMIINRVTEKRHDTAIDLLIHPLCRYEGAYTLALYHARKNIALKPSLENRTLLLFFHDVPDKLVTKDEAIEVARYILNEDSSCWVAKDLLEGYGIIEKTDD